VEMVVKKLGRALDEEDVDDAEAALTAIQQWGLVKRLSRDQALLYKRVKFWVKETTLSPRPASSEADDDDDDDDDAMQHPALRRTAPNFDEPDCRVTIAMSSDGAAGMMQQPQSGERSTRGLGGDAGGGGGGGYQQSGPRSNSSETPRARGGGERSIGEVAGRIKRADTNPNRWFKPEVEPAEEEEVTTGEPEESASGGKVSGGTWSPLFHRKENAAKDEVRSAMEAEEQAEEEEEEEGEVGSAMDEAAVRHFLTVAEAQDDIEAVEALMKSQQRHGGPQHWTAEDDKVRLAGRRSFPALIPEGYGERRAGSGLHH
jgi:hypothetical protein